jgi:hypothetical protein
MSFIPAISPDGLFSRKQGKAFNRFAFRDNLVCGDTIIFPGRRFSCVNSKPRAYEKIFYPKYHRRGTEQGDEKSRERRFRSAGGNDETALPVCACVPLRAGIVARALFIHYELTDERYERKEKIMEVTFSFFVYLRGKI